MKIHIWKMAVLFSVFLIALSFTGSKVRAAEISTIDITINMKWDDEEDLDGSRPEEVTVTLYANGNEIGRSVTLRADEDWEGTFIELPLYYNGELQSYSVVEEKVDGDTPSPISISLCRREETAVKRPAGWMGARNSMQKERSWRQS